MFDISHKNTLPIWKCLGIYVAKKTQKEVVLSLKVTDQLTNGYSLHGGVIATILDAAIAVSIIHTTKKEVVFPVTIDLRVEYYKSVLPLEKNVFTLTKINKRGKTIVFAQSELLNAKKDVFAKATGSFMFQA